MHVARPTAWVPTAARGLRLLLAGLLGAAALGLPARPAAAAHVTTCSEAGLDAALAQGGVITFACGGPTTITITSEKRPQVDTTIDGGGQVTLRGDGQTRLFNLGDSINFTLRNITLDNGFTSDKGAAINAGLWNTIAIVNSTLSNHRALGDRARCDGGGAIYIDSSTLTVVNSTFSGNYSNNGGAINNLFTRLTVVGSTFRDNQAVHSARMNSFEDCGGGGAIYIDGNHSPIRGAPGRNVLVGNTFINNRTNNHGGALWVGLYDNESILVDRNWFDGNQTYRDANSLRWAGYGGAIYAGKANRNHVNTRFDMTNSTLSNNRGMGQGGGLWASTPSWLTNVTFTGNQVLSNQEYEDPNDSRYGIGGAILVATDIPIWITSSTLAGNFAGHAGGAIAGKNATLKNTIFANNSAGNTWKIRQHCTDAETDAGGNIQFPPRNPDPAYKNETNCANTITIADPRLDDPRDNGGGMPTLAPRAGSPAIDLRSPADCPASDQRGLARNQGRCDSGAVEVLQRLDVQPALMAVGDSMRVLRVAGDGFTRGSQVLWNGAPRSTRFINGGLLEITLTAEDLARVRNVPISVTQSGLPPVNLRVVGALRRVYLPSVNW